MRILFTFITAVILGLTLPATAQTDFSEMSAEQQEAFGEAVRSYLLANPQVLLEVIQKLEQEQASASAENDRALVAAYADFLFDDGYSYIGGNPEGSINVVEFLDYRCGYCKRAHDEVKLLVEANPEIRYIVKEFPILGEQSTLASRAAIAVLIDQGNEAYAQFHDALMRFNGEVTENSLRSLAERLDIDADAMIETLYSDVVSGIISGNRQLAQAMQITGTPSFVFHDTMQRGFAPYDVMQAEIDKIIARIN